MARTHDSNTVTSRHGRFRLLLIAAVVATFAGSILLASSRDASTAADLQPAARQTNEREIAFDVGLAKFRRPGFATKLDFVFEAVNQSQNSTPLLKQEKGQRSEIISEENSASFPVIPSENQAGCSVVIRMSTPDGDAFIEGIRVVVENRTTKEKYEQLTDNLGKASFLVDPATNQLFITKLVLIPRITKYRFDSGVITPANAVIEYFIIPNLKNDQVTDKKFQVNLKFSKMNITTSLETGNSLKNIVANVYIHNEQDISLETARASGGKATFYLPAGTDEVREPQHGIRISKINIVADYNDPVDKLRKEAVKSETFPPAAWDHQLVLTDFNSWFNTTKVEMYKLLTDVSSGDIAKKVDKVVYMYGSKTAFNNKIIELTGNFRPTNAQDSESLFHEWTHAIMDMGYGVNEPGGHHEDPCAKMENIPWAWSEGRAHFSAVLLTEILHKPHTDSFTRKIALNCAQMLSEPGIPGEDIETVVAAAMLEY